MAALLWIVSAVWSVPQAASPESQAPKPTAASVAAPDYRAVVNQYCVSCHNARTQTAGLTFDRMDFTDVPAGAEIWEKVVRKVRVGMMPGVNCLSLVSLQVIASSCAK